MTCARSGAWELEFGTSKYPSVIPSSQLTGGPHPWSMPAMYTRKGYSFLDIVSEMKTPEECIIAVKREAKRRGYRLEPA